jgi:hypothetical protein
VLKTFWTAAALGGAILASPAVSDAPATSLGRSESGSGSSHLFPVAALLSGTLLVAIANRRRNPQKVLC